MTEEQCASRDDRPLRNRLEWYGVTLNEPPNGTRGYRNLLMEALHEINRLMSLQAPVECYHCKKEIKREGDWYRCTDCGGHYHKGCITLHARDWRPIHG
jgi:tRNA(Ile2) C34 agmatinyltransferase TiaS